MNIVIVEIKKENEVKLKKTVDLIAALRRKISSFNQRWRVYLVDHCWLLDRRMIMTLSSHSLPVIVELKFNVCHCCFLYHPHRSQFLSFGGS